MASLTRWAPRACAQSLVRRGAWAQSWSSAALAARSVLPSNRPAIPLFSPACWELGFQAWAQSTCPELSAQGLVPLRWGCARMDWLDLLAVQGTLKSLLQHHSSKASILRRSAFFTVQLSHKRQDGGWPAAQHSRAESAAVGVAILVLKVEMWGELELF